MFSPHVTRKSSLDTSFQWSTSVYPCCLLCIVYIYDIQCNSIATSDTSPFKLSTWWYLPIFCSLQHAIACYTVLFRVSYPISKSSPWLVNRVYHAEHVCLNWNKWFSHDDKEINAFLLNMHPQIVLHVSVRIATTSPLHHHKWDLEGSILPLWPNIPDIMISSFLSGWIMNWVPGEQLSASFPTKIQQYDRQKRSKICPGKLGLSEDLVCTPRIDPQVNDRCLKLPFGGCLPIFRTQKSKSWYKMV